MSDPRIDDLPTLDDAPIVPPEPEPAAHDDGDEDHEAAPPEPGDEVEP